MRLVLIWRNKCEQDGVESRIFPFRKENACSMEIMEKVYESHILPQEVISSIGAASFHFAADFTKFQKALMLNVIARYVKHSLEIDSIFMDSEEDGIFIYKLLYVLSSEADVKSEYQYQLNLRYLQIGLAPDDPNFMTENNKDVILNADQELQLSSVIPLIEDVNLTFIIITDKCCQIIDEALQNKNNRLKKLSLRYCHVTDRMLRALSPTISSLHAVLLTGNNQLTENGYNEMVAQIFQSRVFNLKRFSFWDCGLNDLMLATLCPLIAMLRKVNLSKNIRLTAAGYQFMTEYMLKHPYLKLRILSLWNCALTDNMLNALIPLIARLEELNIKKNDKLTENGYQFMAQQLYYAKDMKLKKLSLAQNRFSNDSLAKLFPLIILLEEVDLRDNEESCSIEAFELMANTMVKYAKNIKLRKIVVGGVVKENLKKILNPRFPNIEIL